MTNRMNNRITRIPTGSLQSSCIRLTRRVKHDHTRTSTVGSERITPVFLFFCRRAITRRTKIGRVALSMGVEGCRSGRRERMRTIINARLRIQSRRLAVQLWFRSFTTMDIRAYPGRFPSWREKRARPGTNSDDSFVCLLLKSVERRLEPLMSSTRTSTWKRIAHHDVI
jgi:hypothetical protein